MSYSELRLVLPKDARVHVLAYAIWSAGVTPWSWAMQAGPDFLPVHSPEQLAGWWAYAEQQERERRREHDEALAREINRAQAILAGQGMVLADGSEIPGKPDHYTVVLPMEAEPYLDAFGRLDGLDVVLSEGPQP